jgi:hypothetical protein
MLEGQIPPGPLSRIEVLKSFPMPPIAATLILLWGLSSGLGFVLLAAYHGRPGRAGSPPDHWPSGTKVPLDKTLPTLLIFVHPRCPCSSASLAELAEVASRCRGRIAAHLLSFQPDGSDVGWHPPRVGSGASLPGITRWADRGGREAVRFGVETSGHVLLFEPSGRRLFSGGITISRGHQGGNPGLDELIATILGGPAGAGTSPVFGCPVLAPGSARRPEVVP